MTKEYRKTKRGLYPVKLILWAANILKLPSAARPSEKRTQGYWTHLRNLELDPELEVPLIFLLGLDDFGGILNLV